VTCVSNAAYNFGGQCPPTNSCYGSTAFNCCYGPDGSSPYDLDGDGFIGCQFKCGSFPAACFPATQPCDCNDSNPLIYPGNGC
jgi:hypothetical protein